MNCQTEIRAMAVRADFSSPSHGANSDFAGPTEASMSGAIPHSGDRISFHTNPTITKLRMVGMKIAVR